MKLTYQIGTQQDIFKKPKSYSDFNQAIKHTFKAGIILVWDEHKNLIVAKDSTKELTEFYNWYKQAVKEAWKPAENRQAKLLKLNKQTQRKLNEIRKNLLKGIIDEDQAGKH